MELTQSFVAAVFFVATLAHPHSVSTTREDLTVGEVKHMHRVERISNMAMVVAVSAPSLKNAEPEFVPKTELGRKLLAIRERAIAAGVELKSADEIMEDLRASRA